MPRAPASTLYPQVDAGLAAQRQRLSPSALGQAGEPREFSLYNASVGVRYELDPAGGNRRALEALGARVEHRRFELEGARLTLAANIVTAAIRRSVIRVGAIALARTFNIIYILRSTRDAAIARRAPCRNHSNLLNRNLRLLNRTTSTC